jgi:hypothetical protein
LRRRRISNRLRRSMSRAQILDDIHEAIADLPHAKNLLEKRLDQEKVLKRLQMSATARPQSRYKLSDEGR